MALRHARSQPQQCPGQFIDIVSGGGHNGGGSDHDTTCRDFPPACRSTATCDCMKQVGYSLCSVDAKKQLTIIEELPTATTRSRE